MASSFNSKSKQLSEKFNFTVELIRMTLSNLDQMDGGSKETNLICNIIIERGTKVFNSADYEVKKNNSGKVVIELHEKHQIDTTLFMSTSTSSNEVKFLEKTAKITVRKKKKGMLGAISYAPMGIVQLPLHTIASDSQHGPIERTYLWESTKCIGSNILIKVTCVSANEVSIISSIHPELLENFVCQLKSLPKGSTASNPPTVPSRQASITSVKPSQQLADPFETTFDAPMASAKRAITLKSPDAADATMGASDKHSSFKHTELDSNEDPFADVSIVQDDQIWGDWNVDFNDSTPHSVVSNPPPIPTLPPPLSLKAVPSHPPPPTPTNRFPLTVETFPQEQTTTHNSSTMASPVSSDRVRELEKELSFVKSVVVIQETKLQQAAEYIKFQETKTQSLQSENEQLQIQLQNLQQNRVDNGKESQLNGKKKSKDKFFNMENVISEIKNKHSVETPMALKSTQLEDSKNSTVDDFDDAVAILEVKKANTVETQRIQDLEKQLIEAKQLIDVQQKEIEASHHELIKLQSQLSTSSQEDISNLELKLSQAAEYVTYCEVQKSIVDEELIHLNEKYQSMEVELNEKLLTYQKQIKQLEDFIGSTQDKLLNTSKELDGWKSDTAAAAASKSSDYETKLQQAAEYIEYQNQQLEECHATIEEQKNEQIQLLAANEEQEVKLNQMQVEHDKMVGLYTIEMKKLQAEVADGKTKYQSSQELIQQLGKDNKLSEAALSAANVTISDLNTEIHKRDGIIHDLQAQSKDKGITTKQNQDEILRLNSNLEEKNHQINQLEEFISQLQDKLKQSDKEFQNDREKWSQSFKESQDNESKLKQQVVEMKSHLDRSQSERNAVKSTDYEQSQQLVISLQNKLKELENACHGLQKELDAKKSEEATRLSSNPVGTNNSHGDVQQKEIIKQYEEILEDRDNRYVALQKEFVKLQQSSSPEEKSVQIEMNKVVEENHHLLQELIIVKMDYAHASVELDELKKQIRDLKRTPFGKK